MSAIKWSRDGTRRGEVMCVFGRQKVEEKRQTIKKVKHYNDQRFFQYFTMIPESRNIWRKLIGYRWTSYSKTNHKL